MNHYCVKEDLWYWVEWNLGGVYHGILKYGSCEVCTYLYHSFSGSNFLCIALLFVSVGFVSDATVGLLLLFLFCALFRNFDLKLISVLKLQVLQLPKLTQQLLGNVRDQTRRSLLSSFSGSSNLQGARDPLSPDIKS